MLSFDVGRCQEASRGVIEKVEHDRHGAFQRSDEAKPEQPRTAESNLCQPTPLS